MYVQALKIFNVEIRKAGRGYSVFVTDENGNPVRHPVRMSNFEERPNFYQSSKLNKKSQLNGFDRQISSDIGKGNISLKSLVVRELMLQIAKHRSVQKAKGLERQGKAKKPKGKRH